MTLYEFNQLSREQQFQHLWMEGKYLANREAVSHSINLYSLDGFFCEVWYQNQENIIESIKTFKTMNALEPYLDLIDINI